MNIADAMPPPVPGLSGVTKNSIPIPPSVSAAYASVATPKIPAPSLGFNVVRLGSVDPNKSPGVYLDTADIAKAVSNTPGLVWVTEESPVDVSSRWNLWSAPVK